MKVVGYARVSLDCDVADVLSRSDQEDAIRRWADAGRHRLVGVFCDEGSTASTGLESRVHLGGALAALRAGEADALVVARLERLARDPILLEQLVLDVAGVGGHVFSAARGEEGDLTTEPLPATRALIRDVLRAVPEYQRAMRDVRVRYRIATSAVPADREQATLARIEQLADQGASPGEIAQTLAAEGFTIP